MENHPAYKYCLRILSKKDYSRAKIRKKLIAKEYEDVAEELIELLVEKKYLREDYYIEARIKGMMKKNYSPTYIKSKLAEEEVFTSYELIDEIFKEWDYNKFGQIEDLIRKKCILHNWQGNDFKEQNNKVKLIRFIHSKGHNWEDLREFF
jgi:regulatory protein